MPPHDLDAEGTVISAVLIGGAPVLDELREQLTPDDFYAEAHQRVYAAALALSDRDVQVDLVAVATELRARGQLEQVGGTPYLIQVTEATPATAHVAQHAETIVALARRRAVQRLAGVLAVEASEPRADGVAEWLQTVEARVYDVAQRRGREDRLSYAHDLAREVVADLNRREPVALVDARRVPTSMESLTEVLQGGWLRGIPYIIGARPGMGKTALVLQEAMHVAQQGLGVVIISCEMPRRQLADRGASMLGRVTLEPLLQAAAKGEEVPIADFERAIHGADLFARLPLAIDDTPAQTIGQIRSAVRRADRKLRAERGVPRLGMVAIDYLQILNGEHRRGESRNDEVSRMSAGILALAKAFDVPVLLLSQLSREGAKREPELTDLRDSGAIEQDAASVLFIRRRDYYERDKTKHDGTADLIVAKQRIGGVGRTRVMWDGPTTRFFDSPDARRSPLEREHARLGDDVTASWGSF